ncbi:hypothetical protein HA630_03825, partial [Aquabacterium sp. A08]|nr:hypothetical protein [Aquabacterium sp. A08]
AAAESLRDQTERLSQAIAAFRTGDASHSLAPVAPRRAPPRPAPAKPGASGLPAPKPHAAPRAKAIPAARPPAVAAPKAPAKPAPRAAAQDDGDWESF